MTTRLFRIILTLCWITLVGALIAALMPHRVLPPELASYLSSQQHNPLMWDDYIAMIVVSMWILATVFSFTGLYLWKAWSRRLFMMVVISGFVIAGSNTNPFVCSSLGSMLLTTHHIFIGLLIGCMYYDPDIKVKFKNIGRAQPTNPPYSSPVAGSNR